MKKYDAYKPSGIEWIGELPKEWKLVRLKYLTSYNDDVLPETTAPNVIVKYVEIADVNCIDGITNSTEYEFKEAPSRARRITQKNDVIISTVRTYLKAIAKVSKDDLIVSTGFIVLRPKKMHEQFLAYSALSENFIFDVISQSVGVSYPAINSSQVVNIKIPVPPQQEQTAIADYLDARCAKIDNVVAIQRKRIELLKELKQSIITHAVTKGLDKNAKMKDSGIDWFGKVPECWETRRLKFVCSKITDGSHFSPRTQDEGKSYVTVSDVNDDVIDYINSPKISIEDFNNLVKNGCQPQVGDVLLAKDGTVGRTAIVEKNDFVVLSSLGILSPGYNNSKFLKYLLDSDVLQQQMINSMAGSALQRITISKIVNFIGLVPPLEEQTAIADYLDNKCAIIDRQIAKVEKQIELLSEYKQSVITECVTGKRKVC